MEAVEEVAPPIQYRVVAPGAVREGPELESVKIAQLAVGDVITVHQHEQWLFIFVFKYERLYRRV